MIILMQPKATAKQVAEIIAQVEADGYHPHLNEGDDAKIIGVVGESATPFNTATYEAMSGVASVKRIHVPYKLASREMHPKDTLVPLSGHMVGGKKLFLIAGPCSVESREQIIETAHAVKEAGAMALRVGHSNHVHRHIAFRDTVRKGYNGWQKPVRRQACLSSRK